MVFAACYRVRNYVKKLVDAGASLPLKLDNTMKLGGDDGFERGFKLPSDRGTFRATLEAGAADKRPNIVTAHAYEADDCVRCVARVDCFVSCSVWRRAANTFDVVPISQSVCHVDMRFAFSL